VDQTNPFVVHAAVGAVAINGLLGNAGIWKSTDGGMHWVNTTLNTPTPFGPLPDTAPFSDLVMDPANPQHLYAAGDPFGNTFNGLYETTNGGTTWAFKAGTNFPTADVGRITLAIAPSNPVNPSQARLYAAVTGSANSELLAMIRSDDGGAHWTLPLLAPSK
jgi:hypothetical protein